MSSAMIKPLCILVAILAPLGSYGDDNAEQTVTHFYTRLLESSSKSGYEKRVEYLEPVVAETFSVSTMARITMGRNWRPLTDTQKREFRNLLQKFIVSSLANNFEGSGHRYEIGPTRQLSPNRVMVKTTLNTTEGEQADLIYQLIQEDNRWYIYDIVANGVSDLAMKRSIYAKQFESDGFESVLATIRSSIEENEP